MSQGQGGNPYGQNQQYGGISMPGYSLSGEQPKIGPPGIPGGYPGPVSDNAAGIQMPAFPGNPSGSVGNSAFGLAGGNGANGSTGPQFMGNPAAPSLGSLGDNGTRFTPMPPVNAPQGLLGPDAETLKRQLGYRIGG